MNVVSILEAKRDGQELTAGQIQELVNDCVSGKIPDYQMAALLMAIYFRGLNARETRALTAAMRDSGERLEFPADDRPLVDKHSTGGVGDKVSLVLVPLLASLGFRVPMISGRGLGITGGTLDKVETIPGFKTRLSSRRITEIVQKTGCVICGPTEQMVPADETLYGLRDVTGTVPSIPLITASILCKKLVENISALILDVKYGAAAFMPKLEQARQLAETMVDLGSQFGVRTRALVTQMDTPLGRAAGNWLEIKEAVRCLECRGPEDLEELVIDCAAHLLLLNNRARDLDEARAQAAQCLVAGQPRRKLDEMLAAQGADLAAFRRKLVQDSSGLVVMECATPDEGFVVRCDARMIGEVIRDLGGGRFTKDSVIDGDVGIDELAKPGEAFGVDSLLARVHARTEDQAARAAERLRKAFLIAPEPPQLPPLIQEFIG